MKTYYIGPVMVDACDEKTILYKTPQKGALIIAEQGHSGRWTKIGEIGPEAIAESNLKLMTEDKVRGEIERRQGFLDIS